MLHEPWRVAERKVISEAEFRISSHSRMSTRHIRGEPCVVWLRVWVSEIGGHTRLRHTGGMVAFSSSLDVDITGGIGAFASVNANLRGYRPVAVTSMPSNSLTPQ